jgi:hypothetical protein
VTLTRVSSYTAARYVYLPLRYADNNSKDASNEKGSECGEPKARQKSSFPTQTKMQEGAAKAFRLVHASSLHILEQPSRIEKVEESGKASKGVITGFASTVV